VIAIIGGYKNIIQNKRTLIRYYSGWYKTNTKVTDKVKEASAKFKFL